MALKKNLDVMIQEKLYDQIICGNWTPGQALNLDELASYYGVSRTPVHQALKKMHTQGMVTFSSKGHFSVLAFSEKEVYDIIEMRLLLEQQAINDLDKNELPIDFKQLDKLCKECIRSSEADDIVQTRRTDLTFHRTLVAQANNHCLSELYDRVQGQFMVANYLLTHHTHAQQEVAADDHEKILLALHHKDFLRAHSFLEAHIQGACQKIIAQKNC